MQVVAHGSTGYHDSLTQVRNLILTYKIVSHRYHDVSVHVYLRGRATENSQSGTPASTTLKPGLQKSRVRERIRHEWFSAHVFDEDTRI